MFTGIITAQGQVAEIMPIGGGRDMRLVIATPEGWLEGAAIGASIACSGCCLTVVARDAARFTVEVSAETLAKTTLSRWAAGGTINLERALRMGDEMGGHVVSGHVDGVGEVVSATPENGSLRILVRLPPDLARFVAPKGSVTIEGVSLTVNEVRGDTFGVNLIPHTAQVTTLGGLSAGAPVNIEIDMLARYVARLRESEAGASRGGETKA
ncbi:riboflavin synthase [Pseudoroseomonas rhizosphaerae]|uniref:Riboflavin synthase n=1 Tax=Teichococcus rhizosphaerae TaxID=1335062 RepID=A0A2C7AC49_9PROT|nr:riboflavin synthase [Pseudoroseomonas rhizosphaerae]PHK95629.1 riboflavin synthase [Pseudoroseomonas rhizosphaerae]